MTTWQHQQQRIDEFVEACHQAKLADAEHKIGCVQHDCAACRAKEGITYIHNEHLGNGVFDIIRMPNEELLFSYLDKHGHFNVFKTMTEFADYLDGCDVENRVCIADVQLDENDPHYEEGVDALDHYLRSLV